VRGKPGGDLQNTLECLPPAAANINNKYAIGRVGSLFGGPAKVVDTQWGQKCIYEAHSEHDDPEALLGAVVDIPDGGAEAVVGEGHDRLQPVCGLGRDAELVKVARHGCPRDDLVVEPAMCVSVSGASKRCLFHLEVVDIRRGRRPTYPTCIMAQKGFSVLRNWESSVWATLSPPTCLRLPFATSTRAKRAGYLVSRSLDEVKNADRVCLLTDQRHVTPQLRSQVRVRNGRAFANGDLLKCPPLGEHANGSEMGKLREPQPGFVTGQADGIDQVGAGLNQAHPLQDIGLERETTGSELLGGRGQPFGQGLQSVRGS
jgi:hypothetical protein